jgi:hypothetical protein
MHLHLWLANALALATLSTAAYCTGGGDDQTGCYCNAVLNMVCNDGKKFGPIEPNSGQCNNHACINNGGIKHIYGSTSGDRCHRLVTYGSTDCSQPTYTSTTDQCNRGEAGLTSANAQWYSWIAYCGGNLA